MTAMDTWNKLRRWIIITEDGDGSIYACSRDCAEAAVEALGGPDAGLGECLGRDGVDVATVCDGGCEGS